MRRRNRNRLLQFIFVSCGIALGTAVFNPSAFLQRLISWLICFVFSANTICPVAWSPLTGKVNAANPPAIEQSINQSADLAQVLNGSPAYVFYVNGIKTPGVKFENDMTLIRNFFKESGIKVAGVDGEHNPTGITLGVGDVFESIVQDFIAHGSTDKRVVNGVVNKIRAIDENLSRLNPTGKKAKFLLIGHSQGTFFIEEIADHIQSYYPQLANRVSILALSPFTSYKKIRMRKLYLLRKDDLPKAHFLARLGLKGSPKPNLPPLQVVSSQQSATQNISQSMSMDACGKMQMNQNLPQTGQQTTGGLFQSNPQSLQLPPLVMERPASPTVIVGGNGQITTVPGTIRCDKPSSSGSGITIGGIPMGIQTQGTTIPEKIMLQSLEEQSQSQASPDGFQSQTGSTSGTIINSSGTMSMNQTLNTSSEQVTFEPATGWSIHRDSHRLDYYLGSLTNHFGGFQDKYIYSINLARNTAIQYIQNLLNYDAGTYQKQSA